MALVFLVITIMMTITKSTSASKPTFLYTVCPNTTATFANHSQYQTNLNTVFESLSSNSITSTGFHATSAGDNTKDAVYGLFLCRGDQNATSCKACVDTATTEDLPTRCPNKEVGYIRYDECTVRYSNESFFGRVETAPRKRLMYTVCPNTTATFANHSQYQTNLKTVFESLSTNSTKSTGFHATRAGNNTKDAIYGLLLCRGDQNATSCKACVDIATTIDLPTKCLNKEVGYIRYDECIVRYSNESLLGRMETAPRQRLMNTQNITGNLTQFKETMVNMLNSTAIRAASGGTKKKYATDIVPYTSLRTIYGMAQCTPDLSSRDCFQCLSIAIKVIPLSTGAQTLQPSCSVRYENYPFWNGAFNSSLPPRATPLTNNNTNVVLGPLSGVLRGFEVLPSSD